MELAIRQLSDLTADEIILPCIHGGSPYIGPGIGLHADFRSKYVYSKCHEPLCTMHLKTQCHFVYFYFICAMFWSM